MVHRCPIQGAFPPHSQYSWDILRINSDLDHNEACANSTHLVIWSSLILKPLILLATIFYLLFFYPIIWGQTNINACTQKHRTDTIWVLTALINQSVWATTKANTLICIPSLSFQHQKSHNNSLQTFVSHDRSSHLLACWLESIFLC